MRNWCLGLFLLMSVVSSPVHGQVTIDVAKISCRQFLLDTVAPTKSVALWLSGYYNGKRGTTIFERGDMTTNVDKLEMYCRKHHDTPVMDAAKAVLGVDK